MPDLIPPTTMRGRIRRGMALLGEVVRSWEPLLWLTAGLLAAGIVSVRFDIGQNADGLLQTLMSLNHLTVFFWEQNRFANLLPLLTSGIADPTANAEVQLALRIMAGIAAPLLFAAPLARDGDLLRVGRMTLLATGLALAFGPQRFLWEWFIEASPYGTSFALGGGALLSFDAARRREGAGATAFRLGGLLLTAAAYMVNVSMVLFTAPLFGLLALTRGSRLAVEFGLASAIGGIATLMAANSASAPHTALLFGQSFIGLTYYLGMFAQKPGYFLGAMLAIFALCVGIAGRARGEGLLGYGLMLLATFAVAFVAISLNSWVIANELHPRYLVPLYILAASLGGISIVTGLEVAVPAAHRSRICLGLCMATLLLASQRSVPPVFRDGGIVDSSVAPVAAAAAADLTRLDLDGIAGSYWIVWPAIFLAEQRAHELGQPPGHFFGASERGRARRAALRTRLLATGRLDFACLDLAGEPCRVLVRDVIGLQMSLDRVLLPQHDIGQGHSLGVVRLTAGGA